jgi:hypothetical protein
MVYRSASGGTDVVGLYLNPPDKGLILCAVGKSQIQALQRTHPPAADHEEGALRHHDASAYPPPADHGTGIRNFSVSSNGWTGSYLRT